MEKNVRKFDELKPRFKSKPSGLTPITAILSKVLKNNMPNSLSEKKLLTIIVTDGEPTNTEGKIFKIIQTVHNFNEFFSIIIINGDPGLLEFYYNLYFKGLMNFIFKQ